MVWVKSDFKNDPIPTPLPQAGTPSTRAGYSWFYEVPSSLTGSEGPMVTFPKSLSVFAFNLTSHNSKDCVFLILAPLTFGHKAQNCKSIYKTKDFKRDLAP